MHSAPTIFTRPAQLPHRPAHPRGLRLLAGALSLAVLAACGSDGPSAPGSGSLAIDAATASEQRAQIRSALEMPVIASLLGAPDSDDGMFPFPVVARLAQPGGPEALLALTRGQIGASLALARPEAALPGVPAPSFQVMRAAAAASAESFVDPSLWGRTFVRTGYDDYEVDASATGAPARGVRVMLYERLASGGFGDVEVGYADFIDSTTADRQVGRVNVYDADGRAMGSLRFTFTEGTSGSATTTTITFDGTLGPSGQQFEFADSYGMTLNAGDLDAPEDFVFALKAKTLTRAPFANVTVSMDVEYGTTAMKLAMEVRAAGRAMRLESGASVAELEAGQTPLTRVLLDGRLVAVLDPETETLEASGGGPLSMELETFSAAMSDILESTPSGVLEVSGELTSIVESLWLP